MTRDQIADGLSLLVLQLANNDLHLPSGWEPHEWAYVKGIASGAILQWKRSLVPRGTDTRLADTLGLSETHGGD